MKKAIDIINRYNSIQEEEYNILKGKVQELGGEVLFCENMPRLSLNAPGTDFYQDMDVIRVRIKDNELEFAAKDDYGILYNIKDVKKNTAYGHIICIYEYIITHGILWKEKE